MKLGIDVGPQANSVRLVYGSGGQTYCCEHPPSYMLGIKFAGTAFWERGARSPLIYFTGS